MLLGIIIGVAGLAIVAIAYLNRNELDEKSAARRLAPYVLGAVVSLALGAALIILTAHNTTICPSPCGVR